MTKYNISLRDAATPGIGSSTSGVYILFLEGRIMKVGSAKIGIQKRMQQYFGLNPHCGLNCYITPANRERITVTYQLCPSDACEELESKLFDKYGPLSNLPWAEKRPHSTKNCYKLCI